MIKDNVRSEINKTKNKKKTTLSEQVQNTIEKLLKRSNIDTPNTYIHDDSLSWLGTGTTVKSGGVKILFMDPDLPS